MRLVLVEVKVGCCEWRTAYFQGLYSDVAEVCCEYDEEERVVGNTEIWGGYVGYQRAAHEVGRRWVGK